VTTIGLVSDTHYHDRLFALPVRLAKALAGVDLILHAGDVGELAVLDELSALAPVVAVHGNDEPAYVQRDLPYEQLVAVGGVRILLWRSHYRDPAEERAMRLGPWGPKLARLAARAREVGARVLVYGHTHVPCVYHEDGILLVNPGALASGTYFTRQVVASVARLEIGAGACAVTHINLATGQVCAFPAPAPDDNFRVLGDRYQEWIVAPELVPAVGALRVIPYEDVRAMMRAHVPLYRRCLESGAFMTRGRRRGRARGREHHAARPGAHAGCAGGRGVKPVQRLRRQSPGVRRTMPGRRSKWLCSRIYE
jgi:putative phosphoesterase